MAQDVVSKNPFAPDWANQVSIGDITTWTSYYAPYDGFLLVTGRALAVVQVQINGVDQVYMNPVTDFGLEKVHVYWLFPCKKQDRIIVFNNQTTPITAKYMHRV